MPDDAAPRREPRRAAELRESKNAAHQRAVRALVGEPDPVIFTATISPELRDDHRRTGPGLDDRVNLYHFCTFLGRGERQSGLFAFSFVH